MNEYIQDKIQNFKKWCKQATADSGYSLDEIEDYEELVKKYTEDVEEAYNRGVEDSLKQIPADRLTRELQTVGWNECKQQTIDNISKLLTNK